MATLSIWASHGKNKHVQSALKLSHNLLCALKIYTLKLVSFRIFQFLYTVRAIHIYSNTFIYFEYFVYVPDAIYFIGKSYPPNSKSFLYIRYNLIIVPFVSCWKYFRYVSFVVSIQLAVQ